MKTSPKIILKEIADDFNQFLKCGELDSYMGKIDPNLKIEDISKLLRIHFVLTTSSNGKIGVINFVDKLPQRIRRIKTTTKKATNIFEGEVKGRINFQKTIKKRYDRDPKDNTLFVCDIKEKDYDIAENLVLKHLLGIIYSIVDEDLKPAFDNKYDWIKEWINKKDLRNILNQLYLKNIYLKRVDLKKNILSERMINRATKSRIALYKEAAELITRYNKLTRYDLDLHEAKELLKNTFIRPKKEETLFELYWTIKIIKQFGSLDKLKFRLIDKGRGPVAIWEMGNYVYKIYHDSFPGHFRLKESAEELSALLKEKEKNNYLGREIKVLEKMGELTGSSKNGLWGGRPDILLEKYEKLDADEKLVSLFIGEVKFSQDQRYAIQGLKELLEYIAFIRSNYKSEYKYFEDYSNLFEETMKLKGALFLDSENKFKLEKDDKSVFVIKFKVGQNNLLDKQIKKWDEDSNRTLAQ